jgi:hypothetical protein
MKPMPEIRFNATLARVIAGAGSFALTCAIFIMIYLKPELAKDDLFKSLAQAVIIQGMIGLVLAFLFTGGNRRAPQEDE